MPYWFSFDAVVKQMGCSGCSTVWCFLLHVSNLGLLE